MQNTDSPICYGNKECIANRYNRLGELGELGTNRTINRTGSRFSLKKDDKYSDITKQNELILMKILETNTKKDQDIQYLDFLTQQIKDENAKFEQSTEKEQTTTKELYDAINNSKLIKLRSRQKNLFTLREQEIKKQQDLLNLKLEQQFEDKKNKIEQIKQKIQFLTDYNAKQQEYINKLKATQTDDLDQKKILLEEQIKNNTNKQIQEHQKYVEQLKLELAKKEIAAKEKERLDEETRAIDEEYEKEKKEKTPVKSILKNKKKQVSFQEGGDLMDFLQLYKAQYDL